MKINYVIGKCADDGPFKGEVSPYMFHNQIVFYGKEKDAFKAAKSLSKREGEEYRVFQLIDLGIGK